MTEVFSSIDLQVYTTSWVSLWSDVVDGAVSGNRGIMSNKPEYRLADAGKLKFTLRNDALNSARQLAYYSPGSSVELTGWTTGLPVRLIFSYKGFTRVKWYGHIDPDGIRVIPGTNHLRQVEVTCSDWIGSIAYHRMNLLQPQTNYTIEQAVDAIIANLALQPLNTDVQTVATMPYVFDNLSPETSALSELNKIALSNSTYVYVKGNETDGEALVVDDTAATLLIPTAGATDKLLLETGDRLLLEDGSFLLLDNTQAVDFVDADIEVGAEISYGANVYNQVTLIIYPRRIDTVTTTVLYTLDKATQLGAGESITFRGTYSDPTGVSQKVNGKDFTTPVASTDYFAYANSDGTGTNYTANMTVSISGGAAECEFTVTNTGGAAFYFGGASILFRLRGRGIYLDEPVRIVSEDATSIATYGVRPLTVDMKYADDVVDAALYADFLVSQYKDPQYMPDKIPLTANKSERMMYAFMFAEPFVRTGVAEQLTLSYPNATLFGYNFELSGGIVKWSAVMGRNYQVAPGG